MVGASHRLILVSFEWVEQQSILSKLLSEHSLFFSSFCQKTRKPVGYQLILLVFCLKYFLGGKGNSWLKELVLQTQLTYRRRFAPRFLGISFGMLHEHSLGTTGSVIGV